MPTNKLIYLISDGSVTNQGFQTEKLKLIDNIKVAVESGIDFVQIREKSLDINLVYDLTCEAVSLAKDSKTKILVNERFDIALGANAAGVHLTSNSIPISLIREIAPRPFIIGVSCHSAESIRISLEENADFVTFSPIFHVDRKLKPKGLNKLAEISALFQPFPVIALGGIDESNYADVLEIASGFASIRFLNSARQLRLFSK